MITNDSQKGIPFTEYTDTKANIEATASPVGGMVAVATDNAAAPFGTYNGTVWIWSNSPSDIIMPKVGTPTLDTLADDFTTRGSSGVADGTLTYVTVGSTSVKLSVAAGEGYIRKTNDQQGELVFCKWSASADLYTFSAPAAGFENVIFIGIEYNAGTPQAVAKAAFTDWNWYDNFPLARCSYDGTTMRILNAYAHAEDIANLTRKWMRLNFPFHREEAPEGSGGLELSVSLRALAMTAGKIWHGYNNYSLSAFASGGAFVTHYKRSGGGFNKTSGVTSYPNTQYDDGSGTLQDLTANRYGTLWVYVDVTDGALDVMYGAVNAVSVALAQEDTVPTTPEHLRYHGKLIGRIIFQKSGASPTLIESAWGSMFATATPADHNLLTNLQGGAASEYYHVTAAQNTVIGNTSGTNTGDNAANTTANTYADGKVADAINDGTTTIAPSQNAVFDALALKQSTSGKDASGGYAGLTLFKINFKNVLNTFTSFFTNSNTAARTYTFKDADGTVAFTSDITGTNSGTNSGDVSLAGTPNYITIVGQVITRALISLAHMADVATGTVFYRKTAGTGSPEVQTLATLKTDLGLTGTNSGDQTGGTPAIVLGSANTAGASTNFLRRDDTILAFDATVPENVSGTAAVAGVATVAARRDHVHKLASTSAFLAYNSATDANVTGDNTVYTVIFDTEIQDVGANYNNATGVFTAPYTGFYLFQANALIRDVAVANHSEIDLNIVVTGTSANTYVSAQLDFDTGKTDYVISNTAIVYMTATDTAKITATVFGSSKVCDVYGVTAPYTRFSGVYLG